MNKSRSILLALLILVHLQVYSQAGLPDPVFGAGGVTTTTFGPIQATSYGMAVQADGKVVLAGFWSNGTVTNFAVARYLPSGMADFSFDGDGKLTFTFGENFETAFAVAIQPDGKIVVAGQAYQNGEKHFALARLNPDGSFDTSFDGDGKVITGLTQNDYILSLAIQPDGKLVVAGSSNANTTDSHVSLVRYNSNGSLDASFDGDGIVTANVSPGYDEGYSIRLQRDNKIILAASVNDGPATKVGVLRFNTDGSPDLAFNGNGAVITTIGDVFAPTLTVQNDDKIVVATTNGNGFSVLRYTTNGILDNSFDNDGILNGMFGTICEIRAVLVQPDGKILIAGHAVVTGGGWDFVFARYNSNGSPDNSFDGDGNRIMNVNGNDFASCIALSGSRILIGGGSNQVVFTLLGIQGGSVTLPLQLVSFSASGELGHTNLHWQTATEENTSHFEIEVSNNGSDFSKIGNVAAAGSSTSLKNYTYTDLSRTIPNTYYRLKMIDNDGAFTYSRVLHVSHNNSSVIAVHPNPVQRELKVRLRLTAAGKIQLHISDITGRMVESKTFNANAGEWATNIDVAAFKAGVYFITIKAGEKTSVQQFIKQ